MLRSTIIEQSWQILANREQAIFICYIDGMRFIFAEADCELREDARPPVLAFYESIRQQAEADRTYKHRVTDGPAVRQYADQLREEMIKRRLQHWPIDWPV